MMAPVVLLVAFVRVGGFAFMQFLPSAPWMKLQICKMLQWSSTKSQKGANAAAPLTGDAVAHFALRNSQAQVVDERWLSRISPVCVVCFLAVLHSVLAAKAARDGDVTQA